MAKNVSLREKRKVSIWLGLRKPDMTKVKSVDVLKDLCGVKYYDLDDQEVSAIDNTFPRSTVSEILGLLSYSSSFLDAALSVAREKKVSKAFWAIAQYDFEYNPRRIKRTVAADPVFLGVFEWNDSEDEDP